jgi:hypothetical protein
MTEYRQRDNTATLFKNDKKEKDSDPVAKGTALIDGVEYFVTAWINEGKKGKYTKLSFTKASDMKAKGPPRKDEPMNTSYDDPDDPLPF